MGSETPGSTGISFNRRMIAIDTLGERMSMEAIGNSSAIFGHWQTAAWSRV
jgi:hypothetical protein